MNILYLATRQHFLDSHAGFSHVFNITRALAERGHKVTLLMRPPRSGSRDPSGQWLRKKELDKGFPLTDKLTVRFVDWRLWGNLIAYRWALQDLKELDRGHDIIHERYELHGNPGNIHAKLKDRPLVLEANSPFVEEFFSPGSPLFHLFGFMRHANLRMADRVIVQSSQLKEMFSALTPPEKLRVVSNGVDPHLFDPAKVPDLRGVSGDPSGFGEKVSRWLDLFAGAWFPGGAKGSVDGGRGRYRDRLPGNIAGKAIEGFRRYCERAFDRDMILFVGSFRYWHGVLDLVKAFPAVVKEHRNAELVLMGSGHLLGKAQELVRSYEDRGTIPKGSITLTGSVPYALLPLYLRTADVCAAPFNFSKGHDETKVNLFAKYGMWWSPLKIFEYMAMEKAVVAPGIGSLPYYLGQDGGLTYNHGSVEELASSLLLLLQDKGRAREVGRRARARAISEFSWDRKAEETAEVYRELVG